LISTLAELNKIKFAYSLENFRLDIDRISDVTLPLDYEHYAASGFHRKHLSKHS